MLAALHAPGPVHYGLDSASALATAAAILEHEARRPQQSFVLEDPCVSPTGRPWALRPDGDVWEHIHRAIRAKGPGSIAFTKIKAHATSLDLAGGVVTVAHSEGNTVADETAKAGASLGTDRMAQKLATTGGFKI